MTAISNAITKSLLDKLPAEAAEKFELDEDKFKEFLKEFLSTQLKSKGKGAKSAAPKGNNGKGRITGYILFSTENRTDVKENDPDLQFADVGKELGKMWRALDDAEKEQWKTKAVNENTSNGLPAPKKKATATKSKGKAVTATKSKGKAVTATKSKGKAVSKAKTTAPKLTRNADAKVWVIQGTNFVVQSSKVKVVIGKLRANKVVALSATDIKKCKTDGWEVKKEAPKAPAKSKAKAKEVENDDEDDEDDDDDDDDEDEGDK